MLTPRLTGKTRTADPLTVTCPHCQEPPGNRCGTVNAYAKAPHKARVRLALKMAAHADPALDEWPGFGTPWPLSTRLTVTASQSFARERKGA